MFAYEYKLEKGKGGAHVRGGDRVARVRWIVTACVEETVVVEVFKASKAAAIFGPIIQVSRRLF